MAGQLRTIVYSRVSTNPQERDGTSLDTQERASQEYVEANAWTLVGSIRDTVSGARLDRQGVERLRFQVRKGSVDMKVAYAVDRPTTSAAAFCDLPAVNRIWRRLSDLKHLGRVIQGAPRQ
jgi:site-specific DNA recombinase